MKFSLKLLLCTMIVMALGFGFSGFYFVNYVFETAMDREVGQALDDNSILRFAFETAALNVPAKYDVLQDNTIGEIASNLETGGHSARRMLRLSDEQKQILYASSGFDADSRCLDLTDAGTKTYRVIKLDKGYYIQAGTMVNALDRALYLETLRDVSDVFRERALGFSVYRQVTIAMLVCGTFIMHLISSWLTRPIRLLTRATKRMASGDYHYRARKVSGDELGQLTSDFNQMANALEDNIGKLDEEKQFMSANYIYTEGKRLETMSFRLLDIMVTRRSEVDFTVVSVESLFVYLYDMNVLNKSAKIYFNYDEGFVWAEANLIKSVLMNLLDNACKASEADGLIEVYGRMQKEGYRFEVKDHGVGIPKEEQHKITKAFYMVDKSRSRSRNGAGLGLALCAEILLLHKSRLEIESEPGKGTCMSFVLPTRPEEG